MRGARGLGSRDPKVDVRGRVTWARGGRAMTLAKAGRTCVQLFGSKERTAVWGVARRVELGSPASWALNLWEGR